MRWLRALNTPISGERAPSYGAIPSAREWAPDGSTDYVEVNGTHLHYMVTGEGPPLVLLHTLGTQMIIFHRVVDELSDHFRVYSLDYPGHGRSDTPKGAYTPDYLYRYVRGFLETCTRNSPVPAEESIGGPLALRFASEHPEAVDKVIAINPYDYGQGCGIYRGSMLANVIFRLGAIPGIGEMVWRMRFYRLFAAILTFAAPSSVDVNSANAQR